MTLDYYAAKDAAESNGHPRRASATDFTYPSTTTVNAAFESILDQLDTERRTSDLKDKEGQAFWRNQYNSFTKAQYQYLSGVRPLPTGASYLLSSATRPGAVVHRVHRAGDVWLCSCESTSFCWHAALIAAQERAMELIEQELVASPLDVPTPERAEYERTLAEMGELFDY